jgi:hypothetical protein
MTYKKKLIEVALPLDAIRGRSWHTAVWTGSQMIVWGEWDGSDCLRSGSRYSP